MAMFSKSHFLLINLLTISSISLRAQGFDYGLVLIYNSSSHTNYDPTLPEDGTFLWNSLGTWSMGGFCSKDLSQKFGLKLSLLYQQKGYKELAQVGYIPGGQIYDEDLRNTFNYLSSDVFIKYRLTKSPTLNTHISLGIEYSYLLDYEIESDFFPINSFYPVNSYQDQWETNNLSIIPTFSICFQNATTFEFGFNRSLTPVLKSENLVVKDWIWTIRLSQSIKTFIKSREN